MYERKKDINIYLVGVNYIGYTNVSCLGRRERKIIHEYR